MSTRDRRQALAAGALALLLLACGAAVAMSLQIQSNALQELGQRREVLSRLEARSRTSVRTRTEGPAAAPAAAFLAAPTQGLAAAQLQGYLSQLITEQHGVLVSSGVQPAAHDDAGDTIRVQATVNTTLDALQSLLYRLESGVPYVFVDQLSVGPGTAVSGAEDPPLRATLGLRAVWRKGDA